MPRHPTKPENTEHSYQTAAAADFYNSSSNSYVKSPGGREIYETYRPNEIIPDCKTQADQQKIMLMADMFYKKNSIVRSVIDLQSQIAVAGISIQSTDESTQAFYNAWSKRINLKERAEQFARWYLRCNNVVCRRNYGKLKTGKVPVRYFFFNPGHIELIGDFYGTVGEKKRYGIKIPATTSSQKRLPTTDIEKEVYNSYPTEVKKAIENRTSNGNPTYIPLNPEDIYLSHYKKDDTSIWAVPYMYSIFSDLFYNEKVKLAKTTMLDGSMTPVGLWKLGDHKNQLMPSPALGSKLLDIIQSNTNGGPVNVVWDSAIEYQQYYPPLADIAGFEEKLEPILWGMGIQVYQNGGATNALPVGLKDFISRINGCRDAITAWLQNEFDIIRKAMGFRKNPIVSYDYSDLYDDKIYWTLVRELVDRNIISEDRIRELLHENSEIERYRIDQDEAKRQSEESPQKASPFHNPMMVMQQKHELKKIQSENLVKEKTTGKSGGRPVGSRDKMPRVVKASTVNFVQAMRIYDRIDKFIQAIMMKEFNVKDARQLTNDQKKNILDAKIAFYPLVPPDMAEATDESIASCIDHPVSSVSSSFAELFKQYSQNSGINKLTNEELKLILVNCYCESWNGPND